MTDEELARRLEVYRQSISHTKDHDLICAAVERIESLTAYQLLLTACQNAADECRICAGTGKQTLYDVTLYPFRECPFCKPFRDAISAATKEQDQ